MKITDVTLEATGISVASKTTYTGGGAAFLGLLAQVNWLGVIGSIVAVVGLIANIYFQLKRDKRETRESNERIRRMRADYVE